MKKNNWVNPRKRLDLAFSGTGNRRFPACIGVLRVIEEKGWTIRRSISCSGSALILGMYHSGLDLDEIENIVLNVDYKKYATGSIPKLIKAVFFPRVLGGGYMNNGKKIERFFSVLTKKKTMGECRGLNIVATDMCNGRVKVFSSSTDPEYPVSRAIRASISQPFIWNGVDYRYSENEVARIAVEELDEHEKIKGERMSYLDREAFLKKFKREFRRNTVLFDGGLRYRFPIDYLTPLDAYDTMPIVGFNIENKFCTIREQYNFKDIFGSIISNMTGATDVENCRDRCANARFAEIPHGDVDEGNNTMNFSVDKEERSRWVDIGRKTAESNWDYLVGSRPEEIL